MDTVEAAVRKALPLIGAAVSHTQRCSKEERETAWAAFCEMAEVVLQSRRRVSRQVLGLVADLATDGGLNSWAYSMANQSVNREESQYISYGIIALLLENGRYHDRRERFLTMVLIENSAKRLNIDFATTVSDLMILWPYQFGRFLTAFLWLPPSDKSLDCVGHQEVTDEYGFRYIWKSVHFPLRERPGPPQN